jgi:Tol biopolymer transport system component
VEVVVLYNSTSDREPGYSPNGKKTAYEGYDYEIYTINVGGGGRVLVTDNGGNDHDPCWGSK